MRIRFDHTRQQFVNAETGKPVSLSLFHQIPAYPCRSCDAVALGIESTPGHMTYKCTECDVYTVVPWSISAPRPA